jgi:GntP family gluconate:H+ symporter
LTLLLIHIIAAIVWIIVGTSRLKINPLICLTTASIWVGMAAGLDFLQALNEFTTGFGGLIGQIGLIIILGCVLGVLLEKSRAAFVLAQVIWQSLGKKIPALSTTFMGYLVGIPVFCDSGFILLNPIGKNLARTSGISPLTFSLSLAGGLYLSHILIPPTPGPLAVAGIFEMEQQIGLILLIGGIVSIPSFFVITWWANRFKHQFPKENKIEEEVPMEGGKLPSAVIPALVILLPLALITLGNLTRFVEHDQIIGLMQILGNPVVAISIGLFIGLLFLRDWESGKSMTEMAFKSGIESAGPILILTGAGAGFGAILRQANLEQMFQSLGATDGAGGIFWILLAFALVAFLKTAQGSSTSAMIIGASIILSIIPLALLEDQIYTVLIMSSIGAGAMAISHANDSYFWIIKEFTGLTVKEALKSFSLLSALMAVTTLVTILLIYWLAV